MTIKPLTRPQFRFLSQVADPTVPYSWYGKESWAFLGADQRRWVLRFVELGFMEKVPNTPSRVYTITAAGFEYLQSNGVETRRQYISRRRAQGKQERIEAKERRDAAVEKNLGELDDFLSSLPVGN